jgi:hypothetical protein
MLSRRRTSIAPALVLGLLVLLLPAAGARADQAYDQVAAAYAQAGGQLDACAFSEAQLTAAIAGIPPQIRDVVPDLRRAMEDGVAAHQRGDCENGGGAATGGGTAATTPTTPTVSTPTAPATTPVPTTAPTETAPAAPVAPAATTPTTPPAPLPAPAATTESDDGTGLLVALVAAGALLLLALLLWGWARMRGWDPTWVARRRHAWGEAGYRVTSTWSEFTDWLRLGR